MALITGYDVRGLFALVRVETCWLLGAVEAVADGIAVGDKIGSGGLGCRGAVNWASGQGEDEFVP